MITSGAQEVAPEDAQDMQAYEHEAFEQVGTELQRNAAQDIPP